MLSKKRWNTGASSKDEMRTYYIETVYIRRCETFPFRVNASSSLPPVLTLTAAVVRNIVALLMLGAD
jgi:hypothetical protein